MEKLRHHEVHHTYENDDTENAFNSLGAPPSDTLKSFQLLRFEHLNADANIRIEKVSSIIEAPKGLLPQFIWTLDSANLVNSSAHGETLAESLLNIINMEEFELQQEPKTIDEALKFFGLNAVTAIASQLVIKQTVDDIQIKKNSIYQKIWLECCISGSLALLMAQELALKQPGLIAVLAMLQPIGTFAIVAYEQSFLNIYGFEKSLFTQVQKEQRTVGLNRAIIAANVAKQWQLPNRLVDDLSHSLDLLCYTKPYKKLAPQAQQRLSLCYLANRISCEVAFSGLRDISQFHLANKTLPEFHFLQEALEENELSDSYNLMKNANFCDKANQIILKLAGPKRN